MQQPRFHYHAVIPRRREINNGMMCLLITPIVSFFILMFFYRGLCWFLSFVFFLVITFLIGCIISVLRRPRRASITANFGNFSDFGIVDAGLDNSAIEALPTFEYERENNNNNTGSHEFGEASSDCSSCTSNRWAQCAICLGVLKIGDVVKQLPACKHIFHIECIDKWLRLHSTCPMCRSTVFTATSESPV